jgi:hypothetical protein
MHAIPHVLNQPSFRLLIFKPSTHVRKIRTGPELTPTSVLWEVSQILRTMGSLAAGNPVATPGVSRCHPQPQSPTSGHPNHPARWPNLQDRVHHWRHIPRPKAGCLEPRQYGRFSTRPSTTGWGNLSLLARQRGLLFNIWNAGVLVNQRRSSR